MAIVNITLEDKPDGTVSVKATSPTFETMAKKAVNLMTAICRESNIPFDVYVQACVLNYRAVRRTHPNLVRATEEVCDVADNKQNPGGN